MFRSGHTEAAVDLCKLSGLPPVGVISELMNDNGSVMKGEQVARFAAEHELKHVTIADLIAYRQAREKLIEHFRPPEMSIRQQLNYKEVVAYVVKSRNPAKEIGGLSVSPPHNRNRNKI